MYKGIFVFLASIMLTCTALALTTANRVITQTDQTMHWQPVPSAPNLKYAVLTGNPKNREFFIVRLKMPENYTDIIHEHEFERYDTVISGDFWLAVGEKIDRSKAKKLPEGSFFVCPAHTKHYGFTDSETVIQISGIGPWKALETAGAKR